MYKPEYLWVATAKKAFTFCFVVPVSVDGWGWMESYAGRSNNYFFTCWIVPFFIFWWPSNRATVPKFRARPPLSGAARFRPSQVPQTG